MEWIIPVNNMLKDDITKLNYNLIPPGFHGDMKSVRVMQGSLSKLIDQLGEQSAAAQGLNKVITTAEKLRNCPTHTLYLLKDATAKGGKGEVIGLLKVGRKRLFLFDEHDKVCEVEPLCVLDFFVLKDRQRHGYGQLLFDHMLHDMETATAELAIDGPSPKMERFLARNYGVERLIRQNNNFAVSPQFFNKACEISKSGRSTPVAAPAVGRFAAPKPPSSIATVIHGGSSYYHETSNGKASGRATPNGELEPHAEPPFELRRDRQPSPAQKPTSRPSSLQVEPVTAAARRARTLSPAGSTSPAGTTTPRRDSQLTDRGFFDVKFYHNKLW